AADIWGAFERTYGLSDPAPYALVEYQETAVASGRHFSGRIKGPDAAVLQVSGKGNGLMSSLVDALRNAGGPDLDIADYQEHAIGQGAHVQAAAYVECRTAAGGTVFGVGIDADVATASVKAILSAANRAAS